MADIVLVLLDRRRREALARDLGGHADLHVACVTDEPDCVDAALAACAAPVLVLDVRLLAFWCARHPRPHAADPRVLLCVDDVNAPEVRDGVAAGVHGCLPHDASPIAWRDAIRAVTAGEYWIPRRVMADALARLAARASPPGPAMPDGLTPRQHEIVRGVAEGLSNKAIARRLGISPTTVKTHLQNIFERSGVHGRAQLTRQALGPVRGQDLAEETTGADEPHVAGRMLQGVAHR